MLYDCAVSAADRKAVALSEAVTEESTCEADYMYETDFTQQVKQQNKKQTTFIAKRTITNCLIN